jgi:hypothetical protein
MEYRGYRPVIWNIKVKVKVKLKLKLKLKVKVKVKVKVKLKVKLSLCLTNSALRHKGVWWSGSIDPYFLDLFTSWRRVVSLTPLPLYPQGKSPQSPLDMRLGRLQNRSGKRGEEKILDSTGTRTLTPWPSSP